MDLHDEIAKVARELYEKSGFLEGRDQENWLEAEKIVLSRHAGQDMEEPEGEEAIVEEETIAEEVEGTELKPANQEKDEETTIMEEIEVRVPFPAGKTGAGMTAAAKKRLPAKKGGSAKKTAHKKSTSKK